MKIKLKSLIICIIIPLAVGGLAALLTMGNMNLFDTITKPPLSPPGWLFPVVWTILYTLMGIASYLVYESNADIKIITKSLTVYAVQLFLNFFWSIFFFNMRAFLFSFIWLVLLLFAIIYCIYLFSQTNKNAAYLIIPYAVWVAFAGYLNLAIYILN